MTEDELILTHILGCTRSELYLKKPQLTKEQQEVFESFKYRRENGESLQYILGTANFMGLEFKVTPSVLIPRPETEGLVDLAIRTFKGTDILDIGTGSGNIAILLAKHFPQARVTTVDVSAEAQQIACENARKHDVEGRINFVREDIARYRSESQFDLIISNPPYIPLEQMGQLPKDVSQEPRLALEAGVDGLDFYRIIIKMTPHLLRKNGYLMMEFGDGQGLALKKLVLKEQAFSAIEILQDLAGRDRIICAQKV